jgi:uncharacterized protein YneF (UPF0154 family)
MNFLGIVLSVLTALVVFTVIGFTYISRVIEHYINEEGK